jgi:hypothetical protein
VGAVCVLVELLRDAVRRVTERWLLLLKRQCKYPEDYFVFMEHTLAVSAMSWSRFLGVKSRVGDVGGGRRISSRRGLHFCFAVAMASSILQDSPWAFGFAWKEVRPQRTHVLDLVPTRTPLPFRCRHGLFNLAAFPMGLRIRVEGGALATHSATTLGRSLKWGDRYRIAFLFPYASAHTYTCCNRPRRRRELPFQYASAYVLMYYSFQLCKCIRVPTGSY